MLVATADLAVAETGSHLRSYGTVSYLMCVSGYSLTSIRLEGPVIDVLVGERNAFALKSRTWYLPRSAWAHFSPTLETLCSNVDSDPVKKRIGLPGRNPTVFAMFVEWMCKLPHVRSLDCL
jgi:hypothetical protein